jgi:hypothetical protein
MPYHLSQVQKMFVGHVRFGADGAAEFATGWNEAGAPKETISALSRPVLLRNRGWFDAYATSNASEPFEIVSCRCGGRPAFGSKLSLGTSPLKR